jgi:hypothetical protein
MAKKWYPDCEYALVLIDFGGSQLENIYFNCKKIKIN